MTGVSRAVQSEYCAVDQHADCRGEFVDRDGGAGPWTCGCVCHRRRARAQKKPPRVSEKAHQSHGVQLMRGLGGKVYVIGHPSPNDGRQHRGTGQTPGVPDVLAFLPPRRRIAGMDCRTAKRYMETLKVQVPDDARPVLLFWEAKAKGGRLRPEQAEFRALCQDAQVEHVVGDFDALIGRLAALHYVNPDQFAHYRQPQASEADCELSTDAASAALQQFVSTRFQRREQP